MVIRIGILFLALLSTDLAIAKPPGGIPPGHAKKLEQGNYVFTVGGTYKGKGTGTVTPTAISFSCDVQTSDGNTGKMIVSNLAVDSEGHFSGVGTVCGQSMTVSGRVDLPEGDDADQTAEQADTARITATCRANDGTTARVVGVQNEKSDGSAPGKGKKEDD